jgi:hypothetical protein
MRIVALYAPREERRAEVPATAVVATSETFCADAMREEAEQTEEELIVAVVVLPS